jgi:hypothetical protein
MNSNKLKSPIWKTSREQLLELVQKSSTIGEILRYFGLMNKGGNHKTLKARLQKENISLNHLSTLKDLLWKFY